MVVQREMREFAGRYEIISNAVGSQECHKLKFLGICTLEACSYEDILILLSVDAYTTVVLRNVYHLYLGIIVAKFLLEVYLTTLIHDKVIQVLSVLYGIH